MRVLHPLRIFSKLESTVCIWLNGDIAAERPVWAELWNGAYKRYCTDGAANVIVARRDSLKLPDTVTGDFDSILPETEQLLQNKALIANTPDQNRTDLTKCLQIVFDELRDKPVAATHVERILLLGGLSGRFDHTMATLNSLLNTHQLSDTMEVYVLDGVNLAFVMREGHSSVVIDQNSITGKCGIVPFCQRQTIVSTQGFCWNLEKQAIEFGGLISTSNEIESSEVIIITTAPLLLTIELKRSILSWRM